MNKTSFSRAARLKAFRLSWPFLFAFIGCSLLGTSPIFVRIPEIGPISTGFYRLFFSLPFAFIWLIVEHHSNPQSYQPHTRSDRLLMIASGFFFALDLTLWHWSLKFTSIVNAALFNNFTAFYVTFLAWMLFSERPASTFFIALALGILGSIILTGGSLSLDLTHFGGDMLALASALAYAGYIMCIKRLRLKFNTPTLMLWSGVSASVFLFILSVITNENMLPTTSKDWIAIFGLALIVHIGGQGLLAYSMGQLSAGFVSLLTLTSPIVSAALAWFLFNEDITFMHGLGGIMILAGIVIARQGEERNTVPPHPPNALQTSSTV